MSLGSDPRFVQRLRRSLGNAAPGADSLDENEWRRRRDSLRDVLDPTTAVELTASDARTMIDLFAEAAPSAESRLTAAQWRAEVDELVGGLVNIRG